MRVDINNTTKEDIDLDLVRKVAEKFCQVHELDKELSIAFVEDKVMREINKNTRDQDKETDILSFPGDEESFGELIIDYEQIKRQSLEFSKDEGEELVFILVHGLFHLLGYTDETEEKRLEMIELGKEFIIKYL